MVWFLWCRLGDVDPASQFRHEKPDFGWQQTCCWQRLWRRWWKRRRRRDTQWRMDGKSTGEVGLQSTLNNCRIKILSKVRVYSCSFLLLHYTVHITLHVRQFRCLSSLISEDGYFIKDTWSRVEMAKQIFCGEKEIVYWQNEFGIKEEINEMFCPHSRRSISLISSLVSDFFADKQFLSVHKTFSAFSIYW